MLDLKEYVDKVVFEQKIEIPTDAVKTEIHGDLKGVKVLKLYDVEPVLKQCEFFRQVNRNSNGFTWQRQFRHIACIPVPVALQIMRATEGDQKLEEKFIKKWLKHNPKFLTVDSVKGI